MCIYSSIFIKITLNKDAGIMDDWYTSSWETRPDWLVSLTFNTIIWWRGRKWGDRLTERNMVLFHFSSYIVSKMFLSLLPFRLQTLYSSDRFTLQQFLFSHSIVLILQFFWTSQCCNFLIIWPGIVLISFNFSSCSLRLTDYTDSWQLFWISLCKDWDKELARSDTIVSKIILRFSLITSISFII